MNIHIIINTIILLILLFTINNIITFYSEGYKDQDTLELIEVTVTLQT